MVILSTGVYPDDWKCAHIIPIYKGKGSHSALDSYRPISILSPVSKLFEKLLAEQIYNYLESNKLLNAAQFGFRRNLSCELALTTLMENLRNALDSGNDIIAVFLDLSKAFDTIDHVLLLHKLQYYYFDIPLIALFKNYLSNRTIKVKVNGKLSHSKLLNIGVPQGSVLGPLLFIIYINDMCSLKLNSKIILFADDTTITVEGKNPELIIPLIEEDLKTLNEWFKHNKLVLNVKKSQAMLFNTHQKLHLDIQKSRLELKIACDNNHISLCTQVKLLGVMIDNKLSFGPQSKQLCGKITTKTNQLKKSLYLFTPNFKPNLFKIFIQSLFDYCSTLTTFFSNKTNEDRIENCFVKSLYMLTGVKIKNMTLDKQYESLIKINILPLRLRFFFRFCTFTFNILKNKNFYFMPIYLAHRSLLNTRSEFNIPKFKKTFKQHSFISISIRLLNSTINGVNIFNFDELGSLNKFKTVLRDKDNIIKLFNSSEKFWT